MTRFSQDGGEKYRSFCLTGRKGNSFVPINGGFVGHGKMVSVVGWLDKGEVSLFVGRFVFVALEDGLMERGSIERFVGNVFSKNFFQSGVITMFQ